MPSDDSSWILSLIVMEQYNGEPGALRGACPVLREDCANLPPKGGKAALSYSTLSSMHLMTRLTGGHTPTAMAGFSNNYYSAPSGALFEWRKGNVRKVRQAPRRSAKSNRKER